MGALTTVAYAFSHGLAVLLAARALWGVCYSFLRLGAYLGAVEAEGGRRGRQMGFFNAGQRLGSLVAVTAGAWLVAEAGRTTGFLVLGCAGAVGVVAALAARDLPARPVRLAAPPATPAGTGAGAALWALLVARLPDRDRHMRWRLLSIDLLRFGTAFAANGLVVATVSPYLAELALVDRTFFGLGVVVLSLSGFLVGARWFSDLAFSLPFGYLADRAGRGSVIAAGTAVMVGAIALIAVLDSVEALVVGLPLLFAAGVAVGVAADAAIGDAAPEQSRPGVLGRYATWLDLGAAFGPFAGLPLAEAAGFQAAYGLAAGIVLVTCLAYFAAHRRPQPVSTRA